jgi:hypothetical protein
MNYVFKYNLAKRPSSEYQCRSTFVAGLESETEGRTMDTLHDVALSLQDFPVTGAHFGCYI